MSEKNGFILYTENREVFDNLPDSECAALIRGIFQYEDEGIEPQLEGSAKFVFMMLKHQLDRNREKYNKTREARSQAGKRSAEARKNKQTKAMDSKPEQTSTNLTNVDFVEQKATNPTVKDKVKVKDKVDSKESNNIRVHYTDDFEKVWKEYPRKKEKASAFKAYNARRKEYTPEQLLLATQRYAEECKILDTEERYIKHGSTFFGPSLPFADYLDSGYKKPVARSGTQKQNSFNNFEQRTYDFDALQRALQYKH